MKVDVVLDTESQVVDVEVGNRIVTEIKPILHDETVVGDGIETPMGVNTDVIATKEDLASKADKTDIPDVSNFATKDEIPDVSQFVTQETVETMIGDIESALAEV